MQEWERSPAYAAILAGDYPLRGSEGKRDFAANFEQARSSYAGEFGRAEDPLSKAAGKVMDAFGGLFGSAEGKGGGQAQGQPGSGKSPSIEDVIDEIFGSRR